MLAALRHEIGDAASVATRWFGATASAATLGETMGKIAALHAGLMHDDPLAALRRLGDGIRQVEITEGRLRLRLDDGALARLAGCASPRADDHLIDLPLTLQRRGHAQKLVLGGVAPVPVPDTPWAALFPMLLRWRQRLFDDGVSLHTLAAEAGMDRGHASRLLPLAFLAPDIIADLIAGHGPAGLTLADLRAVMDAPRRWAEQRAHLGM